MYIQLLLYRHIQALVKVLYTILTLMVLYHYVHKALVKVLYAILILMVQYHHVHQALVKGLYTIFILMVPGSIPSSTFSNFIQVLVKVYCTVYTCSTVFSVHELGGQKFIVSVFIKTAERRDCYIQV